MASIEEPLVNSTIYSDDNPYYETCGVQINLRGTDLPDTFDLKQTTPKDLMPFFDHFSKLRDEGNHFDIIVKQNELEIHAHKTLLCTRIPYLLGILNPNWPDTKIVNVPSELDPISIESLINYAYDGSLTITESNAQDIMRAANFLLMESIADECAHFLLKRIAFDDALPLLSFYNSLNYTKLESLLSFIDMNFIPIVKTHDFIELSIDDLSKIIQRYSIRIDCEDQVFDAITRWIGGNTERMQHGMRLLKCIKLNQISSSFFTTIEKTHWAMENQECLDWIKKKDHSGNRRISEYSPKLIFSTLMDGRLNRSGMWPIEIYNPITNSWTMGSITREKEVATSEGICTTWNEQIIFVGGKLSSREYAECVMFNTQTKTWREIPAMTEDRMNFVAEVIGDKLYCAGGKPHRHPSPWTPSKSFEVFNLVDPSQGWSVLPEMSKGRAWATSCVLDGILYLFGGLGPREKLWGDGERFDPQTNEWSPISTMPSPRYHFGAAALNGEIYIVGGWGVGEDFTSVYSPTTDTWRTVGDMKIPRISPKVFTMCGKLYVFGGEDERGEFMNTAESYDPITEIWKDEPPMRGSEGSRYICSLPIPSQYPLPYL